MTYEEAYKLLDSASGEIYDQVFYDDRPYEFDKQDYEALCMAVEALRQPELIRCKDCKHRPLDGEDTQGFGVEFPDEKCPCQCEDGWYNWRPNDDWFCANAERRTDE